MRPQERRTIRRMMLFASILVALMVAVSLFVAMQDEGRPPPAGPEPGAASSPAAP